MKTKKLLKAKTHSYIDYILGALLLASPWLLNLKSGSMESKIIFTIGLSLIFANLITHNKLGVVNVFCVRTHLKIDFFLGLFLGFSPWLYGFHSAVSVPFVFLGILIILNTLFIKIPSKKPKRINLI